MMQQYVDLLESEIRATPRLSEKPLQTVFFGGGTPSLIAPKQLEQLILALDQTQGIAPGAEMSMEADPGTFDRERLRSYMNLGLNRFSIGVQVRGRGLRASAFSVGSCFVGRERDHNQRIRHFRAHPRLIPYVWDRCSRYESEGMPLDSLSLPTASKSTRACLSTHRRRSRTSC